MKKILVLCTGNSCRSQMAEGYLRLFASDRATVLSAGVEAHGLNPKAVETMAADGVDISKHQSKTVEDLKPQNVDFVITVCDNAKERCPYFPGSKQFHRDFPDPAKAVGSDEDIRRAFSAVRDEIKRYAKEFVQANL